MSFDIFFQPCRFRAASDEPDGTDSGESNPLTDSEIATVRSVLDRAGAKQPDDPDVYVVSTPDGGSAEVFASELAERCMFAIRALTPGLVSVLFDVLRAGNWAMLPIMEDARIVTCSPEHLTNLPDGMPDVAVCGSPKELGVLLLDGFDAWQQYRGSIARGTNG